MARGNTPLTEERLDDFEVMYVEAVDGLSGGQAAFQDLEGRLDSLRGRRFYGTVDGTGSASFQRTPRSRRPLASQRGLSPAVGTRAASWSTGRVKSTE